MKISTILDQIDLKNYALPVFQRGYVWNRNQVRDFMTSLYRGYPVGSILTWLTEVNPDIARGEEVKYRGPLHLILDGQQRITSLYGIIRGETPPFFEGNARAFTDLYFNVADENFQFYLPMKMENDPNWINVTELMQQGTGLFLKENGNLIDSLDKINKLERIKEIDIPVQEVTGKDKTIDVVVDIFNRVNSSGTKLSKGDLALAKLCAEWPEARDEMHGILNHFRDQGFVFDMDWLLRCITVYLTSQPFFSFLSNVSILDFAKALPEVQKLIGTILDQIGSKLGLDHDRVLSGRFAFPTLIQLIKQSGGMIRDAKEWNKILFWYIHIFLWGRYSGSTESVLAQDLNILNNGEGIDGLIQNLRKNRGDLLVRAEDFRGWSKGARFYPLMYLLTRVHGCVDWISGIELKNMLLGKNSNLEVHHIFPKNLLYTHGYDKAEVNTLANYTFLTKDTNLQISNRLPKEYFEDINKQFPGALESHWIPMDQELWEIERYFDFVDARRGLLAEAANNFLNKLYGSSEEIEDVIPIKFEPDQLEISSDEEEEMILELAIWMEENGLPSGILNYEVTDDDKVLGIFDIAWPEGVQKGLTEPLALLINEPDEIYQLANQKGFRYFTNDEDFKHFVEYEYIK